MAAIIAWADENPPAAQPRLRDDAERRAPERGGEAAGSLAANAVADAVTPPAAVMRRQAASLVGIDACCIDRDMHP